MMHLPKAGTTTFPLEVTLIDSGVNLVDQTPTLRVYSLDNTAYQLDFSDNQVKAEAPASPSANMTASPSRTHSYVYPLNVGAMPRGHYKAVAANTYGDITSEFDVDFSIGVYSRFGLGYSAVYTPGIGIGTGLKLTLWMEEDGKFAADPTAFNNIQILDATGAVVTGGSIGNKTPTNGLVNLTAPMTLNENTQYILVADVVIPCAGATTRTIKCYVGIARP